MNHNFIQGPSRDKLRPMWSATKSVIEVQLKASIPPSVQCTDLHFFTCHRYRYTVRSWRNPVLIYTENTCFLGSGLSLKSWHHWWLYLLLLLYCCPLGSNSHLSYKSSRTIKDVVLKCDAVRNRRSYVSVQCLKLYSFEALTAVILKFPVFRDAKSCPRARSYQRFERILLPSPSWLSL